MRRRVSESLYSKSSKLMVGGVSSPVRAFKAVGGSPLFLARGKGSHVWDEDGNRFTDYVCSWGALILGHADPGVLAYLSRRMRDGTSFGAPTREELRLAERVCRAMPSVEKLRFVSSGTEATMSALRLARGYTGRPKLLKFDGCYHGHADSFLTKAGSGMATLGLPASAGVTDGAAADTITAGYNDVAAAEEVFRRDGDRIAAAIVEPVAGNMGVVLPDAEFLRALRRLTASSGALLIFDEVITGFRLAPGGAQEVYGVKPDLTTLGKIIGGGLPVGAYGGKKEVMSMVSPEGPVYQAGTLSGNPAAMAAGVKTLDSLSRGSYQRLSRLAGALEKRLREEAGAAGTTLSTSRAGSMLGISFRDSAPRSFAEAKDTDTKAYAKFFWGMLRRGVYLPPSAFETVFVSLAHSQRDIETTAEAASAALREARA